VKELYSDEFGQTGFKFKLIKQLKMVVPESTPRRERGNFSLTRYKLMASLLPWLFIAKMRTSITCCSFRALEELLLGANVIDGRLNSALVLVHVPNGCCPPGRHNSITNEAGDPPEETEKQNIGDINRRIVHRFIINKRENDTVESWWTWN